MAATGAVLLLSLRGSGAGIRVGERDREAAHFLRYTTAVIAGLSLLAIAWDGLPALIIPVCG